MKNILYLLSVLFCCVHVIEAQQNKIADKVFVNAQVYTMNPQQQWSEAFAVHDGKFVYVGTTEEATSWVGDTTVVVDMANRMILPGFHDSHVHPVTGGMELGECDLNQATTEEEIIQMIQDYIKKNPDISLIRGGGWDLTIYKDANPHKSILDAISSDKPIYLTSADAHSAWVNSIALQMAGIDENTKDPEKGRIERDAENKPTGTLREDAMLLVSQYLPEYTHSDYVNGLRRGMKMANEYGITSVQEANADENVLKAYADLDTKNELSLRVVTAMQLNLEKGVEQIPHLVALRKKYQGKNLRANSIKIFADGVIEAQTAAVLDPYLHHNHLGKANLNQEEFDDMAILLDKEGFQIHVHAIGDRAIRISLNAFEKAQKINGIRDSRHHIAHLELIHPDDIKRFKSLGVIANFQPLWAYPDTYITELTIPFLGPERSRWLYPIGSVQKSGAVVAFGSDWSVSSMNPLKGIQVAITRRQYGLEKGEAWIPEELISLQQALENYTINGAYVNFFEHETGSIEVNKMADFVVISDNIFNVASDKIYDIKVVSTFLNGTEIYSNAQSD